MSGIDESSPIFMQLRGVVRERISTGEYAPGVAIPSENTLAKTYGINRLTVRAALDGLVEEGLLKRVQGKGVFVVGKRIERDLDHLTGFRKAIEGGMSKPGVKILDRQRRRAGSAYAKRLGIDPEDEIFYIKRLDLADGEPISMEEVYVPCELFPNLMDVDLEIFAMQDVYDFYESSPVRAWQTLEIVPVETRLARMLKLGDERDALLFTCYTYREDGRVIEFMRSYNRSDACFFTVKVSDGE